MPEINYEANLIPSPGKVYGGNLGGGVAPRSAVLELTNAQILALPTTPIAIVPATEILGYVGAPTRLPVIDVGYVGWKNVAGVYGNITASSFLFAWGSDWSANASNTVVMDLGNVHLYPFGQFVPLGTTSNMFGGLEDNGLYLAGSNTGNFTGGDAANVMLVAVFYRIWNFSTGAFE